MKKNETLWLIAQRIVVRFMSFISQSVQFFKLSRMVQELAQTDLWRESYEFY